MKTLSEKIIKNHLINENYQQGEQIAIKIDQTLTQDATGTMAYLQFETMGIDRVRTELSVSYVDHNTLQSGFENADDHKFLQTIANRYGVYFSKPGNGICHQVHLERFAKPGKTLLGSDSHTPTAGGLGSLAIGAGGLDVALAMAGSPFYLNVPKVVKIILTGKLNHGVSAKDIILKVLSILTVKGGVGKIIEYSGDGLKNLSVPERATICNMGAELGATTSIFPSDEITYDFLKAQGREADYLELKADDGAVYDETYQIDLNELEPLIACPHSPDNVKKVSELVGLKVDQVAVGSCTNSSFADLEVVANILRNNLVDSDVSLTISPGSKQVLQMIINNNYLLDIVQSGARILESACGPCIGMGQSPATNSVSLRTFNRNFYGRSGTLSSSVYLVSPETAAASAVNGYLTDPRTFEYKKITSEYQPIIDDSLIIKPDFDIKKAIVRGPNIKELPINNALDNNLKKKIIIKLQDDITTDHIAPAGAKVLPYRSNIEKISEFIFMNVKPNFHEECKKHNGGIIVAGENYGQGSSREHAALAPMALGIKAVIAKSFARIHHKNLINFGILPLIFLDPKDYDNLDELDELVIDNLHALKPNQNLVIKNLTKNQEFLAKHQLSEYDINVILVGGALNYVKNYNMLRLEI